MRTFRGAIFFRILLSMFVCDAVRTHHASFLHALLSENFARRAWPLSFSCVKESCHPHTETEAEAAPKPALHVSIFLLVKEIT